MLAINHRQCKIALGNNLDTLKLFESGSAGACVTSPPYYNLRDYHGQEQQLGQESRPEKYIENLLAVFDQVKRVLRDDAVCWVNIADTYVTKSDGNRYKQKDLYGIPWLFAMAMRDTGWYLRQDCIWSKPNGMPESATDRFMKGHEYCFLFAKQPDYYFDSWQENDAERTVWRVPIMPYHGNHFATFPPALAEKMIRCSTSPSRCKQCGARLSRDIELVRTQTRPNDKSKKDGQGTDVTGPQDRGRSVTHKIMKGWKPGCQCNTVLTADIVLDPFMGSGTTAETALAAGRAVIGCELNPDYIPLIRDRIDRFSLLLDL